MNIILNILEIRSPQTLLMLVASDTGHGLFGVPFILVLMFLGKIALLFIASALVSKILGLDKIYDDSNYDEGK